MKRIRTYSELCTFETFEERFEYLKMQGQVGQDTFGYFRFYNQRFYTSQEWQQLRSHIIARDHGCDLGVFGHEITEQRIIIHHLNPITIEDIESGSDFLLNPEYLITTIHSTHNAIHYGDSSLLPRVITERRANDTCPWKR